MRKSLRAVAVAFALTIMSPLTINAAPASRTEWKDISDNPVVRFVKSVRKFIVHALAEPQSPPPTSDEQH
jgi:hypothetical protein